MATSTLVTFDRNTSTLVCQGEWDLNSISELEHALKKISWPESGEIVVDGSGIKRLDSAGALLLVQGLQNDIPKLTIKLVNFSKPQQKLISIVEDKVPSLKTIPKPQKLNWFARVGKDSEIITYGIEEFLSFIGELSVEALVLFFKPWKIRWKAIASTIEITGFQALFIIALLSFMIGIVIAYQMGLQLKTYGASIFIVDLLGLAVLREFAPLLTAIMVAGRTGSAFTAQIGTMKVNQEIDALNTMGIKPSVLLLLPRVIGLVVALPLLTMWGDAFGIIGGMIMSHNMLDIGPTVFLQRFQHVVSLRSFVIGIGKAPVFALIIGLVGCYEGMKVQNNADSVGKQTTRSVVLSIFMIIVVDAIFSVLLSKFKL